ncbi:MAG: 1-pyrroline-5-carboxylate dehydrogenase [Acidimicrobiia bacterium]|nr:MAG: 1-pyrroline-5-carboxylate dehydrogenase [Acidimicrobiia bacterium]
MTAGAFTPPRPSNEPVRSYAPGTPERASLQEKLRELEKNTIEAPCYVDGRPVHTGKTFERRAPHRHDLLLANAHAADEQTTTAAIDAAMRARTDWAAMPWHERAAIFLRAAELIAGRHRDLINGSTMLGQSKNVYQAEIDAACETVDLLRFNVYYYSRILAQQPDVNPTGVWNRLDYRPLDGFVLAMTPFNFTAIAANLPTAPALCGNTVVWKPSEKQVFSAHFLMQVLIEAGLPPGVINLLHGDGALVSRVCFEHPDFAGLHFTGNVDVFRGLWGAIGRNIGRYRAFPRVVGETGGKDFVIAHPSAAPEPLVTALVRGAFEYQGQKCSAASRAYIPEGLWKRVEDQLLDTTRSLKMGDVTDFTVFMGAVIDEAAFRKHQGWLERAAGDPELEILVGGGVDGSEGWFVQPTIIRTANPRHEIMETELFGPILTVFVYEDDAWEEALDLVDTTSPFGLTGSVFATDRAAILQATERLRHAAGNFYINDKPTGAIVGQQPFGGTRASGTNDKAGSYLNLLRWMSVRTIKETMDPPVDYRYPHMAPDA